MFESRVIHSAMLCGKRIVYNNPLWRNNLLWYYSIQDWFVEITWHNKMEENENRGESSAKAFPDKMCSFWCPVRAMQTWSWALSSPCILSDRVILRNLLFNEFLGYVEVKCRGKGWVLATSHGATQDENCMGTWHRSSDWILNSEPSFVMQCQRKGMIILNFT